MFKYDFDVVLNVSFIKVVFMFSLPQPFICQWAITDSVIDHYGHVNNVAYVKQIETTAWLHSNALGLSIEQYQAIDRGMAIRTHALQYHQPLHLGEQVQCATWITRCDGKATLTRQFEMYSEQKSAIVFSATTEFVCIALSSGKIRRMPDLFRNAYLPAVFPNDQISVAVQ